MRNLFILSIIALIFASCEEYYTFSGIVKNNSNRTVRFYFLNSDTPRKIIDSVAVGAGAEVVIRKQTYAGKKEIGECGAATFNSLADSVRIKVDTGRILLKSWKNNDNWTSETVKFDVNCRFTINQGDIQ